MYSSRANKLRSIGRSIPDTETVGDFGWVQSCAHITADPGGYGAALLKYKDPKRWQEFTRQLRRQSGQGLSNTVIRCQALRPSLHDLRDQLSMMTTPVLLMVGDEDAACLETKLMLKATLPNAGLWISPNTGHSINLEEPAAFNSSRNLPGRRRAPKLAPLLYDGEGREQATRPRTQARD